MPSSTGRSPLRRSSRPIGEWFTPEVVSALADEIAAAGGQEIFVVGRMGPGGTVMEAEVAARGSEGAVPAVSMAARPGDLVVHNHPSGVLRPSGADLEAASRLGSDGIGFAIVDNECTAIYVVVEPAEPETARPLELDELSAFFEPGGPLARVLPGYEPRRVQAEMALAAAGAFNDGRVVMVEAGTGVGKSMAYLVPSILWARRNRKRVVVSTNTINLQEQLVGADLPLLEEAGLEFRAVLVKGRRNYACLRKADEVREDPDLFAGTETEQGQIRRLAEWAFESASGSLSDLSAPPGAAWEEIATEADDCTRTRCPWYNECHFYRARRRAATADVLVVNHHLLFADLALRTALGGEKGTAVLPGYSHIVLDEAHHVEETATDHFGTRVTSLGLQRQIGRLRHRSRPGRGLLPLLARHLEPLTGREPQAERALERLTGEVDPVLRSVSDRVPELFKGLERAVGRLMSRGEEYRLRITEDVESEPAWEEDARESCRRIRAELTQLVERLERLLRDAEPLRDTYREELDSPIVDLAALTGRLGAAAAAVARFTDPEDDQEGAVVRWLERAPARGEMPRLTLAAAPIEVGPHLARSAFGAVEGAILTSATLAVDESFEFIGSRLGLDLLERGRVVTDILASPFVHSEQVRLLVLKDLPEPNDPSHEEAAARFLAPAITAAGGRALVLFTSYGSLRRLHELLAGPLGREGIRLRRQGEAPRSDLLANLKAGEGEALLATDSFWEGIDVRGEALSLLAMARLPFRVPSEPVLQARAERMEREGGNAFTQLMVPMAVLKFKQGLGRLIRHRQDRGVAVVMDPRLVTRPYGRVFLDSLGWGGPEVIDAGRGLERVREWFDRPEESGP
ncbi:MAG: helicase C-terminal domain-containing protein [bacterium]